jgi:hypothetical protein
MASSCEKLAIIVANTFREGRIPATGGILVLAIA